MLAKYKEMRLLQISADASKDGKARYCNVNLDGLSFYFIHRVLVEDLYQLSGDAISRMIKTNNKQLSYCNKISNKMSIKSPKQIHNEFSAV